MRKCLVCKEFIPDNSKEFILNYSVFNKNNELICEYGFCNKTCFDSHIFSQRLKEMYKNREKKTNEI